MPNFPFLTTKIHYFHCHSNW